MKRNTDSAANSLLSVLAFALIVSLLCGCTPLRESTAVSASPEALKAGVSRILALEAKDPDAVDDAIKEHRRQALIAEYEARFPAVEYDPKALYEARLAALKEDPSAVWSMFEDYVIIGDSRGADFKNIPALDDSRNLAVYANTAGTFVDIYEEIEALNPSYIFVSIGFVDALSNDLEDVEDYKSYMTPLIQDLKDHFPDAKIFMNPLFHSIGEGLERFPRWNRIDEYDAAIREIAGEVGVYYVNCDDILPTEEDYIDDGIHFKNGFMNRWAIRFIETLYQVEYGVGGRPAGAEEGGGDP